MKIHLLALRMDKICAASQEAGKMTKEHCEIAKMNVLVQEIEYLCAKNKVCMDSIAKDIEEDRLPLT